MCLFVALLLCHTQNNILIGPKRIMHLPKQELSSYLMNSAGFFRRSKIISKVAGQALKLSTSLKFNPHFKINVLKI